MPQPFSFETKQEALRVLAHLVGDVHQPLHVGAIYLDAPGNAVNPAQIERQVAGSFVFGLSALLYGECTVKNGAVEQTNFDTYNVMRMDEMPTVDVIVMPSGGFWGGVGEPTISVAAPSVLNAIFAATGRRIRNFPLMNQNLGSV